MQDLFVPTGCTFYFVSTLCQLQNYSKSCLLSLPLYTEMGQFSELQAGKTATAMKWHILVKCFLQCITLDIGGERQDQGRCPFAATFAEDKTLKAPIIVNIYSLYFHRAIQKPPAAYRSKKDLINRKSWYMPTGNPWRYFSLSEIWHTPWLPFCNTWKESWLCVRSLFSLNVVPTAGWVTLGF